MGNLAIDIFFGINLGDGLRAPTRETVPDVFRRLRVPAVAHSNQEADFKQNSKG
jgi:hypothetical protein